MNQLTRQINSMFILGFQGEEPDENLKNLVQEGLGGIIFFAENILSREKLKQNINNFKQLQHNLILSIDQEGGRVQRTNNLPDKIEYISPLYLCKKPIEQIESHYKVLSAELLDFGINMDFAPVLDVFTNPKDPIINERAFGKNSTDVINFSQIQNKSLQKNGIKTVGKHFPGHGAADVDSHIDMPHIDLSLEELQEHLLPFREVKTDAVMISHVHYKAFDKDVLPASLSSNIINYLKKDVGFDGLVISDDMVMGGVAKHFTPLEACIKGIMAGIDMFIFRAYTPEIAKLLKELEVETQNNPKLKEKIELASSKISIFKENIKLSEHTDFDHIKATAIIENIKNTPNVQ